MNQSGTKPPQENTADQEDAEELSDKKTEDGRSPARSVEGFLNPLTLAEIKTLTKTVPRLRAGETQSKGSQFPSGKIGGQSG